MKLLNISFKLVLVALVLGAAGLVFWYTSQSPTGGRAAARVGEIADDVLDRATEVAREKTGEALDRATEWVESKTGSEAVAPEGSEAGCETLGSVISETTLASGPDQYREWRRFCDEDGDYWKALKALGGVPADPGHSRGYQLFRYPDWELPEDANPCSTYVDEEGCVYDYVPGNGEWVADNPVVTFVPVLRRSQASAPGNG